MRVGRLDGVLSKHCEFWGRLLAGKRADSPWVASSCVYVPLAVGRACNTGYQTTD